MDRENKSLTWDGSPGINLPANAGTANEIVVYAKGLTKKQQSHVIQAFNDEAFDMGAEYIWRRSMIKLRTLLETLGMKFIGEMLGREDVDEYSNIEAILTDYNTIVLAEHLGVINSTGALKLKHALEIITHYFSEDSIKEGEELNKIDGISIVCTCVKYILGEQDISVAMEFSSLRNRLLSESVKLDDPQIEQLLDAAVFYHRTVLSILLTALKSNQGAKLEHAINNINILIGQIWNNLAEKDKWIIGTAYRDVTAAGNLLAAKGLKNALLKVKGFDYVPENLRSVTYKKAAKSLIEAHFSMNNYHTEPPLIKRLANLGSTIPGPALIDCIQAYLCVYLGNQWGYSWDAAPIALDQLRSISMDKWEYYFNKVIHTDEIILAKLMDSDPAERFSEFAKTGNFDEIEDLSGNNLKLLNALLKHEMRKVKDIASTMYFHGLKGNRS